MGLLVATASACYTLCPAAAVINNTTRGTMIMWVYFDSTISQGGVLFGKSTANNRFHFINQTGSSDIRCAYAGSVGVCAQNAPWTAIPAFVPNLPVCFVINYDFGTAAPRIYCGNVLTPLAEATSYTGGTNGSGSHDDSGQGLVCGTGGALGASGWTGKMLSYQWLNRVTNDLEELRTLQKRWNPRANGTILAYRMGRNGLGPVLDESGYNNHATTLNLLKAASDYPIQPPQRMAPACVVG